MTIPNTSPDSRDTEQLRMEITRLEEELARAHEAMRQMDADRAEDRERMARMDDERVRAEIAHTVTIEEYEALRRIYEDFIHSVRAENLRRRGCRCGGRCGTRNPDGDDA